MFARCRLHVCARPRALSDRRTHVQLRKWLSTPDSELGLGHLELAEKLVLRNRQLGRAKADSLFRVIRLNSQLSELKQRQSFDPAVNAKEKYTEVRVL